MMEEAKRTNEIDLRLVLRGSNLGISGEKRCGVESGVERIRIRIARIP